MMLRLTRRTLLAAPALLLPRQARAQQPWSYKLLRGGFDGAVHHAGLHITLADGWKTYWRVPGDGGIPPQISVAGANVMDFAVDCPLPQRHEDETGQSIGYKQEVVFPLRITPADAAQPVMAEVSAFIGICEVVCIPANLAETAAMTPEIGSLADAPVLQQWQFKVPVPAVGKPVTALRAEGSTLIADLDGSVEDIFVEFSDGGGEVFALPPVLGNGSARLEVRGLKAAAELQGRQVRLTSVQDGAGLEQVLAIA